MWRIGSAMTRTFKYLLVVGAFVLAFGIGVVAQQSATTWWMARIRVNPNDTAGATVNVVDGGVVCLYVVTTHVYGGSSTSVWGVEKYRLAGRCQ